jgi:hypothetical protein
MLHTQNKTSDLMPFSSQLTAHGDGKDSDAAQTLSNLSQANFTSAHQLPQLAHQLSLTQTQGQSNSFPHSDPGPSSHPRGPPNLGDLSALASQSQPIPAPRTQPMRHEMDDVSDGDEGNESKEAKPSPSATTGKRGGRSATMGSEEWTRQRKDNHVSVKHSATSPPVLTCFVLCFIERS